MLKLSLTHYLIANPAIQKTNCSQLHAVKNIIAQTRAKKRIKNQNKTHFIDKKRDRLYYTHTHYKKKLCKKLNENIGKLSFQLLKKVNSFLTNLAGQKNKVLNLDKIKLQQRFRVYDTFMLRAILGSDSTDSQEDGAAAAIAGGNAGGSATAGTKSSRLAFCRGCSRSVSSSAVLSNSEYGTPATVAPSTSNSSASVCLACEADKQQNHYHNSSDVTGNTVGERKSRRSFATRSSGKMSHSSSSSMRGSSRSCTVNSSKSVSPGSYSCNALNVDFSTYTATHQWTKMLECAEFVGAK